MCNQKIRTGQMPDGSQGPGFTHRDSERIDQMSVPRNNRIATVGSQLAPKDGILTVVI
jgi:hypothetical protein